MPAIEIAVQHANAAGGVNGRPLSLVVEDSKGNPEAAVSAMRKVVQVDGVQAILTIFTNVVSAQMPLAQQLKVPLISPVEAPGLTAKSGGWVFAHSSLLSRNLPPLEAYWKQKGVKKLFCFLPNTPIAPYGSGQFKEAAQRLGASHEEVLYKLGDTDFRGLIVRARAFAPDAIVIFGHGTPDEGLIMKQARELGELLTVPVRALDPAHRLGDEGLVPGDAVRLDGWHIEVIGTPGHTSDSVAFHLPHETVHLHYWGPAHCDGDIIVHLEKARTVFLGDRNAEKFGKNFRPAISRARLPTSAGTFNGTFTKCDLVDNAYSLPNIEYL